MDFFVTLTPVDDGDGLIEALPFASLEAAYLDACAAIPEAAADMLRHRRNPFRCAFLISDGDGAPLMEVPFTDVLAPSERDEPPRPSTPPATTTELRLRYEINRSRELLRDAANLRMRAVRSVMTSRALIDGMRSI